MGLKQQYPVNAILNSRVKLQNIPGKLHYPSLSLGVGLLKTWLGGQPIKLQLGRKRKCFFVCKMPQMGKQGMQCMDNIALACKLQCISLHALKSSAHAVTCAHHICGFTFNSRFISCMIFWEITPELIVFDASLRFVCLDSSGWRSRLHLFICLLYPCLLQQLWHYTLSRVCLPNRVYTHIIYSTQFSQLTLNQHGFVQELGCKIALVWLLGTVIEHVCLWIKHLKTHEANSNRANLL